MTERLAVWTSRRPRLTLVGWALALITAIAITAAFLGDALSGDEEVTSSTESRRADRLQAQHLADGSPDATEVVVVRSTTATVDQPRFQRRVETLAEQLEQAGAVGVATSYDTGDRRLVSRDEHASGMLVALGRDAEDDVEDAVDAVRRADAQGGFEVAITGEFTLDGDFSTLAGETSATASSGSGFLPR
jgi:RND superfamily putative drug exporter